MNLESIAEKLEQAGQGSRGTSIFINMIPTDKRGILLREFDVTPIDYDLPNYRKCSFQMIARGANHQSTKALIDAASLALTLSHTTLTGMHVNYIRPQHEPFSYPLSDGNNVEFVVNMDACYVIVP